jgi:hypothetical protein
MKRRLDNAHTFIWPLVRDANDEKLAVAKLGWDGIA